MIFYNLDKLGEGDTVALGDRRGPYLRVPGDDTLLVDPDRPMGYGADEREGHADPADLDARIPNLREASDRAGG